VNREWTGECHCTSRAPGSEEIMEDIPAGIGFQAPPPAASAVLVEIRTGSVKQIGRSNLKSAIHKDIRAGRIRVETLGLEGDEQADQKFHGGPEKAILHYSLANYNAWRAELPSKSALFHGGAFGENLVSGGFDETTVCVGDIFRVGSAVFQVTQPRQPCFKLNHRFDDRSMSRRVQQSGRTGWYYRVLGSGWIEAGDDIVLAERPHPGWPLRRVQHYLYRELMNAAALQELAALPQLSVPMRQLATMRMRSGAPETWTPRLIGPDARSTMAGEEDR
jgi:MOSC domain-containing protein YiiM